jgi:hypothetical protein
MCYKSVRLAIKKHSCIQILDQSTENRSFHDSQWMLPSSEETVHFVGYLRDRCLYARRLKHQIADLDSAYPPRKRMRLDESNSSFNDFNAPYYSSNDYWPQDLSHSFSSAQFSSTSQPMTASASPAIKTKARQEKASKDPDEIAVCRWNDEVTG